VPEDRSDPRQGIVKRREDIGRAFRLVPTIFFTGGVSQGLQVLVGGGGHDQAAAHLGCFLQRPCQGVEEARLVSGREQAAARPASSSFPCASLDGREIQGPQQREVQG